VFSVGSAGDDGGAEAACGVPLEDAPERVVGRTGRLHPCDSSPAVTDYILDHHNEGECARLELMARLLDPLHRRHINELGIGPGDSALEVGCGNGSMSAWLAEQTAPSGRVLALDLDLSLITASSANLELRGGDILDGPVAPGGFDLVTARAMLHHVADADTAIANLVASARPGGAVLLIEPDFLPVSAAEPEAVRSFWDGWLAWSRERAIDYSIGRSLPSRLAALGQERIVASAETVLYNGGSDWARYWIETVVELHDDLIGSGSLDEQTIDAFLACCRDSSWWTQTIAFTAVRAHRPPG
jgi:2-polyprenyl-3-methyl-5-hydroxy-6-metoxy-1,4-benzoquinol methylase